MQDKNKNIDIFKNTIGTIFLNLRKSKDNVSINKLAFEYDIDKGSLSKIERGIYDCRLSTAYKLSQALGIKFSDFAKMLEDKLGDDFKLIDE